MSVTYFCRGFSCCPYYRGVCNNEVSTRQELTVCNFIIYPIELLLLLLLSKNTNLIVNKDNAYCYACALILWLTTRCHSPSHSHVTVLPVHVMGSTARVVTQPNTKVLDLQGLLLVNLSANKYIDSIYRLWARGIKTWQLLYVHVESFTLAVLTRLQETISPFDFLIFFNLEQKYQYFDLATTSSGPKILIL